MYNFFLQIYQDGNNTSDKKKSKNSHYIELLHTQHFFKDSYIDFLL